MDRELLMRELVQYGFIALLSLIGLLLLFVLPKGKPRNIAFHLYCTWGMVLSTIYAYSLDLEDLAGQLLVWLIGSLSAIAMLVEILAEFPQKFLFTRIFVVLSVLLSLAGYFLSDYEVLEALSLLF